MQITQVNHSADRILADFLTKYTSILGRSEAINGYLSEKIHSWQLSTNRHLQIDFPYYSYQIKVDQWQNTVEAGHLTLEDLKDVTPDYLTFCKQTKRPDNRLFWERMLNNYTDKKKPIKKHRESLPIDAQLLLNEWQKALDEIRTEWELERIALLRYELFAELDTLLSFMKELHEQLETLGLDPGLLLDLSKGHLSPQDIEQMKRWAKYLAEDDGVRSLCALLGKMRHIEFSERIEHVKVTRAIKVQKPDINSREEIVGIKLGRDLEHVLPSELALLSDPDTALLFDLKYVESRLMCFDMQGMMPIVEQHEFEEDVLAQEKEKQGPMVICIDTSGSMSGSPETVAKAVALFMASKAREQKRPCYLINFSTRITTLDLGHATDMASLIKFLRMSFHGGTDAAPAIAHALNVMNKDDYKKADLLVISDFIMSSMPNNMLSRIKAQKANGNCFYSLVIGSAFMSEHMKTLFDQEWVFDPATSCIHELVNFKQRVTGKLLNDGY